MKSTCYCLLAFVCLFNMACSQKTPGGVKYEVHKKGDGKEQEFGQFLVMNMQLKDSKDSVWFTSKDLGNPVVIPVPDASMEKDEGEYGVFKVLTKGDSVSFQLPALTVFTKTRRKPVPKNVDPNSLFKFNIGLRHIWSQQQVQEFQSKLRRENQLEQVKRDSTTIANYLNEKGVEAKSTVSGLRYVVEKEGNGEFATAGKTAYVHYAGFLLNGKLFDTSLAGVAKKFNFNNGGKNTPYPVVVNTGGVIPGWDEMLMLMNKGMKVRVYIPSALGYGQQGNGPEIPGNSILVFDMEVMDIK